MLYFSTRNQKNLKKSSEAILLGIAEDGGLFVPNDLKSARFPMENLQKMSAKEISAQVLFSLFGLELFENYEDALALVGRAYDGRFENEDYAPLKKVGNRFVMELYHGPTCAFKDVALQILPHLMQRAKERLGVREQTVILTATSGDTGSAALCGFAGVEGVDVIVFYPNGAISAVQERQMVSVDAPNTCVASVLGNFDDAQSGVKNIFSSFPSVNGVKLSSANSINIGRLAPQVAYYFKAYRDLLLQNEIQMGETVDFVVPTGNFGDILAGYFAKEMGLPVGKLVCASNQNNVLTDFFRTGVYDKRRAFYVTNSPSMDILISSNLERLLYFVCGDEKTARYMKDLKETGKYEITKDELCKMTEVFACGSADNDATLSAIKEVYKHENYLMDTHTAVAYHVMKEQKSNRPTVVLSTASAYKFASSVLDALGVSYPSEMDALSVLQKQTGVPMPSALAEMKNKKIVHQNVVSKDEMLDFVLAQIEKWSKVWKK